MCRERLLNIPIVIYTKKNFFLLHEINEKLRAMKTAGLIEYWHSQQFSKDLSKHATKRPKVLKMTHLYGSFQVWASGCVMGIMVFTCECIAGLTKNNHKFKSLFEKIEKKL